MLTVILTGAALIREHEQGTGRASSRNAGRSGRNHALENPGEWHRRCGRRRIVDDVCCGMVAAGADRRIEGAVSRGSCFYVFTVAALGILLGTIAATMGQFGLLCIPVLLVMMLLSGSTTPMESMPVWLQYMIKVISPTPHFVAFAQGVLYRGADLSIVWLDILATAAIGSVYFVFALHRFRRVIFSG
jgi:ABC-2 type transport system permease protein